MRYLVCALLLLLGCQEKSEKSEPAPRPPVPDVKAAADAAPPPAVAITVEPSGAADATIASLGKLLQPSAPVMGFAELRPHLQPLAADCKEGSDIACAVFDNLYRYGMLLARKASDADKAELEKACREDNDLAACSLAGEAFYDPANAQRGDDLFALACFQGIRRACARLAHLRLEPGAKDSKLTADRARQLLPDTCRERDAEGCAAAGDVEGLTRACDLADFTSCEALIDKAGGEARARTARGMAIFQAACTRRHHPSCDAAQTLSKKLRGTAP